MKAEEAKTKWCPMVRQNIAFDSTLASGWNRHGGDENCITTECMMWCGDDDAGDCCLKANGFSVLR